jgi:hypothetical protein
MNLVGECGVDWTGLGSGIMIGFGISKAHSSDSNPEG